MDEQQLRQAIDELVAARLLVEEAPDEYSFRHALIHDTAYAMLLLRKRRQYHRAIAETLEALHADGLDAHISDIAYHYYQAGEWAQALAYAQRAGEKAQSLYAPREAASHFTQALDAAGHLGQPPPAHLYSARGAAYELLGEFERAQADQEMARAAAQAAGDRRTEWQALINLGGLWAGRDYGQTGDYYQQALALARTMQDPPTLAYSLNRIGNWRANTEQPHDALQAHREALTIFQSLDDPRGMAETLDYLGVASFLAAESRQGSEFYVQAIARFRALGDRRGLASSMTVNMMRGVNYHRDTLPSAASLHECLSAADEVIELVGDIGWRAGEAFIYYVMGMLLSAQGAYARALAATQRGLDTARAIGHQQWLTATHCGFGMLYLGLFQTARAREYLEQGLALATALRSLYWRRAASAFLALTLVSQRALAEADAVLAAVIRPDAPIATLAQRMCWAARAEWALAVGDAALALDITDRMLAAVGLTGDEPDIGLRMAKTRGEALLALGRLGAAERVLQAAQASARQLGAQPFLWQMHAALGKLRRLQARPDDARQEFGAAGAVITTLADGIPDDALRQTYLDGAVAVLAEAEAPRVP